MAKDVADTRSFCFKYDFLNPKSGRKRGAGKVKSNECVYVLEECGLQGDRKLAVNGNVSGLWEH